MNNAQKPSLQNQSAACAACARPLVPGAAFCPNCGAAVNAPAQPPLPEPHADAAARELTEPMPLPGAVPEDPAAGCLVIVDARSGEVISPEGASELTIGASRASDVHLDQDASVSRKHCRISRDEAGQVTVEDLGSTNGTWVRVQKGSVVLQPGAEVLVGRTRLLIEQERAA